MHGMALRDQRAWVQTRHRPPEPVPEFYPKKKNHEALIPILNPCFLVTHHFGFSIKEA